MAPSRPPATDPSRDRSRISQPGRRIDTVSGRIQKLPQQPRNRSDPLDLARIAAAAQAADPNQELSFDNEYRIKNGVQALLEEAMFYFCQRWMPRLLADQQWHSPLMGELNVYGRCLREKQYSLDERAPAINKSARMKWSQILGIIDELKHIRHSAVHRIYWGLQKLQWYMSHAVVLLEAIQDAKRHAKMLIIREKIDGRQWAMVFQAIDMPLGSVVVKPWYGRKVEILDLTGDSDDEDAEFNNACFGDTNKEGNMLVVEDALVNESVMACINVAAVHSGKADGPVAPNISATRQTAMSISKAEAEDSATAGNSQSAAIRVSSGVTRVPNFSRSRSASVVFGQLGLGFPSGLSMFGAPVTSSSGPGASQTLSAQALLSPVLIRTLRPEVMGSMHASESHSRAEDLVDMIRSGASASESCTRSKHGAVKLAIQALGAEVIDLTRD